MIKELRQMYTGQEKSFNIFEHDHCVVVRVTPYTWELFTKTENTHTSVYRESYGFKHLDKLVMNIKEELSMWDEKCNCGKPARYFMVDGESSCNKYAVCPSYDELESELKKVKQDFMELLEAAESLRFFREGTDYYKDSEDVVLKYKSQSL